MDLSGCTHLTLPTLNLILSIRRQLTQDSVTRIITTLILILPVTANLCVVIGFIANSRTCSVVKIIQVQHELELHVIVCHFGQVR